MLSCMLMLPCSFTLRRCLAWFACSFFHLLRTSLCLPRRSFFSRLRCALRLRYCRLPRDHHMILYQPHRSLVYASPRLAITMPPSSASLLRCEIIVFHNRSPPGLHSRPSIRRLHVMSPRCCSCSTSQQVPARVKEFSRRARRA